MTMWLRKIPSNVAPIPSSAVRDFSLSESVLNSIRFAPSRSKPCSSWRSLASRFAPLRWAERRDPGPADLEPAVLRHDAQEAGAADRAAGGALHGRKGNLDSGSGVVERGLQPCLEAGPIHRPGERPLPQARVERDLGQPVEVVMAQRFEAHDAPFEHDRLDPRRHRTWPRMVAGTARLAPPPEHPAEVPL